MILCFTLSMPSRSSWNGRWSGEDRLYARLRSFRSAVGVGTAKRILEQGCFYYSFDDGWSARVSVRQIVTAGEAAGVRRKSAGFCGYDWMIDSVVQDLRIISPSERRKEVVCTS